MELKDTVELMQSEDCKERLKAATLRKRRLRPSFLRYSTEKR